MRAFSQSGHFHTFLVHTGQHYDEKMSRLFFSELNIPQPDINLEVGSGTHALQTAEIMKKFEPVVLNFKPDYVLVVGDVNSTIACGLVAVKLGIKLIHVEAGLRSFDRNMPEEINRILTDAISDLLFVTEPSGVDNLLKEGIAPSKIHLVGNVMVDTLLANKQKAKKSKIMEKLCIKRKKFAVITLHRPSNVDEMQILGEILRACEKIQKELKLIFPIHPRTKKNISGSMWGRRIKEMTNLIVSEPYGYLDFLCLTSNAKFVMTDSGGIQEETTILGVPCMTLRDNTERPITISEGTNRLVTPITATNIFNHYKDIINANDQFEGKIPSLWDGKAAERIASIIIQTNTSQQNKN
jgi:UDP-N-acetylglucosamine 2-epimerase (non-hydrolysing)